MRVGLLSTPTRLLSLALILACGTEPVTSPTDPALSRRAPGDAPSYSDWSAPVNLGPVVNSTGTELEVFVSRDGRSLYMASSRSGNFDILVSHRSSRQEPWGPAEALGPAINTTAREQAPFLSRDGRRLYFFSDREGGFGGTDLYVATRRDKHDDSGWETPVNLGSGVNTAGNETLPVLLEKGPTEATTLYFSRADIFASTLEPDGAFGPAAIVSELSSPRRDRVLSIRRDGLELFLASDRPGPLPEPFDLWVATRRRISDPWSTPVKLGLVINTSADEGGASLSFDARSLYFTSSRPDGAGGHDIWMSTRSRIR